MADLKNKYSIQLLKESESQTWDAFVDGSKDGTVFHKFKWLQATARYSKTKMLPLACEKSSTGIIAVFPVFLTKKLFLNVLFSPPPGCAIPYLGPVFQLQSDKQPRIESDQYQAIKAFNTYFHSRLRADYVYILTSLQDVRPFKWLKYQAEPVYTYRLLTDESIESLHKKLESNTRNMIKKIEKNGLPEIKHAEIAHADILIDEISERYQKLKRTFKPSRKYIRELLTTYGGKELLLYHCYFNGAYQNAFLTINYNNNMKFWLGGVNNEKIENGINEYAHWHNIKHAATNGMDYYEHIGANTRHLCAHKSRYGFRPEVYYKIEKWSRAGRLFFSLHKLFNRNR